MLSLTATAPFKKLSRTPSQHPKRFAEVASPTIRNSQNELSFTQIPAEIIRGSQPTYRASRDAEPFLRVLNCLGLHFQSHVLGQTANVTQDNLSVESLGGISPVALHASLRQTLAVVTGRCWRTMG